jgi:hypothetical protein
MKNISDEHVIVRGKIGKTIHFSKNQRMMGYESITLVHVIEYISTPFNSDTLYYLNGNGAACQSSIAYRQYDSEIIIKSRQFENFDFYYKLSVEDFKKENLLDSLSNNQILSYTSCDVGSLKIENNICIGNITRNKSHRSLKFIQFVERIYKKLGDHLWEINPSEYTPQKISYQKLKKKIKRKLKL